MCIKLTILLEVRIRSGQSPGAHDNAFKLRLGSQLLRVFLNKTANTPRRTTIISNFSYGARCCRHCLFNAVCSWPWLQCQLIDSTLRLRLR